MSLGRGIGNAIVALCAIGCALALGRPIDDVNGAYRSGPAERDLARLLPGHVESASFVYHFRPGGAAEAGRAALEPRLEEAWKKIVARFDLKALPKADVFVYETAAEMFRLTGRPGGEAAAIG
ncbi:MAG TPA: hypothetical protein VHF22_15545, partial [Planctomycetota bacterium]|nr:hypothetical protein [Planctomycetota bacterium]